MLIVNYNIKHKWLKMKIKNILKIRTLFASIFLLLFVFLVFVLFMNQINKDSEEIGVVKVFEKAPVFTTTNLIGESYDIDFTNSTPTIITFWASWCPPCRKELPILDSIQKENKNVKILGINIDEDIEDAKNFVNQYKISFTTLKDDDFITIKYGVTKIPETFFINTEGKIISRVSGTLTKEKIISLLDELTR